MATTAVAKRLPKPDWTNIQRRDLYKNIYVGLGMGSVFSVYGYFNWYIPKWRAIEEYEK